MAARVFMAVISLAVLSAVLGRGCGAAPRPAVGEIGYVQPPPGVWEVVVAVDEEAERELSSPSVAGNDAAIRKMVAMGRAYLCSPKTKVQVASQGGRSTRFRIMEGRHLGRSGILPADNIVKLNVP